MNKLFLIPSVIGNASKDAVLPADFTNIINQINIFIVEELRTARRFLRAAGYTKNFDDVTFYVLNEHTKQQDAGTFLDKIEEGHIGLLSEAGVPCVADPGALVVNMAHRKNIQVVPMVGPSSILLALMASGMNGQSFTFHGYLPIEQHSRDKKIKDIEGWMLKSGQTQIFIEVPYRTNSMLQALCQVCNAGTLICVASNITQDDEFIKTKTVAAWKKNMPDLHKKNTVFLIGR